MKEKLQSYIKFFKLLKNDQDKEFEKYANTKISLLFSSNRAYYGCVIGVTAQGDIVLKFANGSTPRLKATKEICLLRKSCDISMENLALCQLTYLEFRNLWDWHTDFSTALPLYFMSTEHTIGCGQVDVKIVEAAKKALANGREVRFVMFETMPPTEMLMNLAYYIEKHPDDANLSLTRLWTYDQWQPKDILSTDNVAQRVIETLESDGVCVLQGPPGTGKSYALAQIISDVTAKGETVCVTTQSNDSLTSLLSQDTIAPFVNLGGYVCKTVLTAEEKKKYPYLLPANNDLIIPKGGLLLSTYYSLSRIINTVDNPKYDLIVIEEASQAYLTAIAAFMRLGKKCLIVGDPMQLPPVVNIKNQNDYKGIDIETQANGMMTLICAKDVPSFRMTTSFRLTPKAAEQTKVFYNNQLSSVQPKRLTFDDAGMLSPLFPAEGGTIIYTTAGASGSDCSKDALVLIRKIERYMLSHYPDRKLAILSPYVTTTQILQKEFNRSSQKLDVKVETIHRIQGLTRDYVIYYIPQRNYDFAFSDNLFNVATSRSTSITLIITDMPIEYIPVKSTKVSRFLSTCRHVKLHDIDIEGIRLLYPGLEDIVDDLLANGIEFSQEGDVDLLDANGIVTASAGMLLRQYKIAIDPVDSESASVFRSAGYKIVDSKNFSIEMLK